MHISSFVICVKFSSYMCIMIRQKRAPLFTSCSLHLIIFYIWWLKMNTKHFYFIRKKRTGGRFPLKHSQMLWKFKQNLCRNETDIEVLKEASKKKKMIWIIVINAIIKRSSFGNGGSFKHCFENVYRVLKNVGSLQYQSEALAIWTFLVISYTDLLKVFFSEINQLCSIKRRCFISN